MAEPCAHRDGSEKDRELGKWKGKGDSRWNVAAALSCLWVASLLYGELISFYVPIWSCSWPSISTVPGSYELDKIVKVAVIGDPQLTDRTTHGMKHGSFALKATQFYSDIYMRRAFQTTVLGLQPDEIVFLGDYFDGGVELSESEFKDSLARFRHIFDHSKRGAQARFSRKPVHYLFGNHDLGYAGDQSERPDLRERYQRVFGAIEHTDEVGAVDFVFVDSQSLDGRNTDIRTTSAWNFIHNVSAEAYKHRPKLLLSHIPLYRPDNTPCGALRSSNEINQRITWARSAYAKIVYQNYLSEETTVRLLDLLKPVLVLSGHDHDQCSIKHRVASLSVVEHTVGTFSWQNGNLYPSFMLLSVNRHSPTAQEGIVSSRICFLPYQTYIYIWYAVLLVISLLTLFFWPSQGVDWENLYIRVCDIFSWIMNKKHSGSVKEKQEDANHDYEMVWDAEGSMHLIKKASAQQGQRSTGQQDTARSTAVAHSVVKRASTAEPSLSSAPSSSESSSNAVSRPLKASTVSMVGRWIHQVVGPLIALATLNASLYIMLMLNDWTKLEL